MTTAAKRSQALKEKLESQDPRSGQLIEGLLYSRLRILVSRAAIESGGLDALLFLRAKPHLVPHMVASHRQQPVPAAYESMARLILEKRQSTVFTKPSKGATKWVDGLVEEPLIAVRVTSVGSPVGVLFVLGVSAEADSRLLTLTQAFADLAGVLLDNDLLQRDLNCKEQQLLDLVRYHLEAQEEQRESICLEVHDGVAQTLASAFQYLQAMQTTLQDGHVGRPLLVKATSLVKHAIQESRDLLRLLQSSTVRDLGLVETLRQELWRLTDELGWDVDFQADNFRLPEEVETNLYRIVRELITNVRKHAYRRRKDTRRIRIVLRRLEDVVSAEVQDWGAGFNPASCSASSKGGFGLIGIRRRVGLQQGQCEIQSAPGKGTIVLVTIPVKGEDNG